MEGNAAAAESELPEGSELTREQPRTMAIRTKWDMTVMTLRAVAQVSGMIN